MRDPSICKRLVEVISYLSDRAGDVEQKSTGVLRR